MLIRDCCADLFLDSVWGYRTSIDIIGTTAAPQQGGRRRHRMARAAATQRRRRKGGIGGPLATTAVFAPSRRSSCDRQPVMEAPPAPLPVDLEASWESLGLDDRLLRAISKMVSRACAACLVSAHVRQMVLQNFKRPTLVQSGSIKLAQKGEALLVEMSPFGPSTAVKQFHMRQARMCWPKLAPAVAKRLREWPSLP